MLHFPVLLEESIDFLVNDINGHYIDCTYGRGGHSKLILNKISNEGFLSSFDKDPDAYKHGLNLDKKNFQIHHDSFKNIGKHFNKESIDGIIYDLGTCSTHFDNAKRGFSFNKKGPLDMRFNNTKGVPFSKWLNNAKKSDISEVLYKFGDEKHAKLIASAIFAAKNEYSITNTIELAKIIKDVYPEKNNKIHPATKSFQAFRILINNELDELKRSLENAEEIIKRDGLIVTIAFHSLEDNIVKNFFKPTIKAFPKDIPINNEEKRRFKCIAKKIRASDDEVVKNPRSRSAIMRVFQKI
mgnify:CR=1 FL=1|tara:strand:+ start:625 stop:1518 length:894 start_codon:yes stop_codon:yes gene_type:complete